MQDVIFFKSYNFTLPTLDILSTVQNHQSLTIFRLLNNGTTKYSSWEDEGRALSLSSILRYTNPHAAVILYLSYFSTLKKFGHFIISNQQIEGSDISP